MSYYVVPPLWPVGGVKYTFESHDQLLKDEKYTRYTRSVLLAILSVKQRVFQLCASM